MTLSISSECLSCLLERHTTCSVQLRKVKLELPNLVSQDASDQRPAGVLVIGGHDIPRCPGSRGRGDHRFVRLRVVAEMRALREVGRRELPVFGRVVEPVEQSLFLLVLGDVQEDFDDARAVAMKMSLERVDVLVTLVPELVALGGVRRKVLSREDVGVDTSNEDLFVVRAVEDPDPSTFGKRFDTAPEEYIVGILLNDAEELSSPVRWFWCRPRGLRAVAPGR